ncbi:hypothetical protein [Mucilaginibacter limnophilus]|nr:hypothetical protein [Mucilaginibacter limnophilus]
MIYTKRIKKQLADLNYQFVSFKSIKRPSHDNDDIDEMIWGTFIMDYGVNTGSTLFKEVTYLDKAKHTQKCTAVIVKFLFIITSVKLDIAAN